MLKKLTKRELILLAIFIELLLITLIINSWFIPFLERKEQLTLERDGLRQEWEEIRAYNEQEDELQQSISTMKEAIHQLRVQIPPQGSTHAYWEKLLEIAKASNVEVILIQEGEHSEKEPFITTTLSYQSDYVASLTFMEAIKQLPYFYSVREGSVTEGSDGEWISSLSLQFYLDNENNHLSNANGE